MSVCLYYINLDHRHDRKALIGSEISKISENMTAVTRIAGILNKENGAIGCAASHVIALTDFLFRRSEEYALILEDDFEFSPHQTSPQNQIDIIKNKDFRFDVLLLAYNKPILAQIAANPLARVYRSYTTSGYIVTRNFAYELIGCFQTAHKMLNANQNMKPRAIANELWAIDSWWHNLQSTSLFFAFTPPLGRQRPSYSDVVHQHVAYGV